MALPGATKTAQQRCRRTLIPQSRIASAFSHSLDPLRTSYDRLNYPRAGQTLAPALPDSGVGGLPSGGYAGFRLGGRNKRVGPVEPEGAPSVIPTPHTCFATRLCVMIVSPLTSYVPAEAPKGAHSS